MECIGLNVYTYTNKSIPETALKVINVYSKFTFANLQNKELQEIVPIYNETREDNFNTHTL